MIRASGPFAALDAASVSWSELGRPRSIRYDDGYFGDEDGLAESRHVFIDGSDLVRRLASASDVFTVAELGFGTGVNFLLSWQTFEAAATSADARLHFLSIEREPLPQESVAQALAAFPELASFSGALLDNLPPAVPGVHRRLFAGGRVVLDLYWADVGDALAELASPSIPCVDAWYLDGFAPARNRAMWDPARFREMALASRPRASVATYSAAGDVRRGLEAAGFRLQRRPGFGRKRECIHGYLDRAPEDRESLPLTPWDIPDTAPTHATAAKRWPSAGAEDDATPRAITGDAGRREAIVLGAGLAGAHAAAAFARRGWRVTVLEAGAVADRASGNPQGVLFTRFSHERSLVADFSLAAFLYASHLYRQMFAEGLLREGLDGALTGCLQTAPPRSDFDRVCAALGDLPELGQSCDATEASQRLGTTLEERALWQPRSGWLAPPAVCAALLAHRNIDLLCGLGDLELRADAGTPWRAIGEGGQCIASAPVAVIATGSATTAQASLRGLPLRKARGQTTQLPAKLLTPLDAALSHRGYVAPAVSGEHCVGASFSPGDESREVRVGDHAANLAALADALPAWRDALAGLDPASLAGRAEVRCVSPDYLPMVGPLPDVPRFRARFAALASDAGSVIERRGAFLHGLYLSTAHGSRGLSYAALAAEVIASHACYEAPPLPRQLMRAIAPARFTIRSLIRGTA